MANDLHKEHRERMRKEFLEHGFADDVPKHKILEMLLFYSIPRKDTNEIAHLLLNEFGSISGVLCAFPRCPKSPRIRQPSAVRAHADRFLPGIRGARHLQAARNGAVRRPAENSIPRYARQHCDSKGLYRPL